MKRQHTLPLFSQLRDANKNFFMHEMTSKWKSSRLNSDWKQKERKNKKKKKFLMDESMFCEES